MKTYYEKSLKFKELKLEKVKLKMKQSQSVVAPMLLLLREIYVYIYYIYSIIVVRESGKVDDLWQSRGVVGDKEKAEAASLAAHFPPFKFQLLGRQRKVIIVNGLLA